MPSAIQKRSCGSVTIYSIDEEQIRQALERFVARLAERPEVLAVVLFGSLAEGRLSVGSDVDLLVIISWSDEPFLERLHRYLPEGFPTDVDIFPYTLDEIHSGQPLARQALSQGRILWCRAGFEPASVVE